MKRIKFKLMMMAALLCSLTASAHDFQVGSIFYKITSTTDLTVAVTYQGYAYYSYSNEYSGNLTIPSSVTYGGVAYRVTGIDEGTFYDCDNLTSVAIPSSVISIGNDAFGSCKGLTVVTIPTDSKLTSIGDEAFYQCTSLTSIYIPTGVTSIGKDAFFNCTSLTTVTIPENSKLTSLGQGSFDCCYELTSINIPEGVTSIGYLVLSYCSSLTSITIPESVTSIGQSAFQSCSKLTSVTIPNSVTSIGNYAFIRCYGLTSITIGSGVTSIGSDAFSYCSGLNSITCMAINPPTISSLSNIDTSIPVYVPASSVLAYKSAACWKEFTNIQPISDDIKLYADWTSTNKSQSNSTSSNTYTITANAGDVLTFDWLVSSESNYDKLIVTLAGTDVLIKSGELSGTYQHTFPSSGTYTMVVKYTKDGSVDRGSDYAKVYNITLESVNSDGSDNIVDSGVCGANLTWELANDGTLTIEGTGEMTSSPWYNKYSAKIKSVVIGEGLTSIVHSAFYDCSNLTSVTIPASVTNIGTYAFYYCLNLSTVVFAEDSMLESIGEGAFGACGNLTSITIPASVTEIGINAFMACSGLTSITCKAVTPPTVGNSYVFDGVDKSIPFYVPYFSVEDYANRFGKFNYQRIEDEVYIPTGTCGDNLTWRLSFEGELRIEGTGRMANFSQSRAPWQKYEEYVKSVVISDGVTSIGESAFYNCYNLLSVSIPEGVTTIGACAFYYCNNLPTIIIPESVTGIMNHAFYNCYKLNSITLPENLSLVGPYAFYNCGLQSITCEATTPPVCYEEAFTGTGKSIPVYVPKSSVSAYQAADYWKDFTNIQPMLTIVASGTCGDNLTWKLTDEGKLIIEGTGGMAQWTSGYNSVPWSEYRGQIQTVEICNGVTSIGIYAFYNCYNLTSIIIPSSVTDIAPCAFTYCGKLTSINIPEGVTHIYYEAFRYCALTSIVIPESVVEIQDRAFESSGLTSITIPKGVNSITYDAFLGCSKLTSINVADGNVKYDSRNNCNALIETSSNTLILGCSTTVIPDGVTSIGNSAFYNCYNLSSINIPESVTSIGEYAFFDCRSLTSINIPKWMESIGECAFYNCNFSSITCHAVNPPAITNNETYYSIFEEVDKSIPVYVLASSLSIYQTAEDWCDFTNIQAMPDVISLNQYGSATYCSEYALDFSGVQGLKAYAATGYNTSTGVITLTRVMTSKPGMGLFLKGAPGEYVVPTLESTDDNSLNMLVGTLGKTIINKVSDNGLYKNYRYTINSGETTPMFYEVDDNYTLSAGKAYLQIPVAWLPVVTKAIGLRFVEGNTTDIDEMESADNGQQTTAVYDLMGRKVTAPQEGVVYIVDGKKMVWK